jgi:hypothetical protein
LFTSIVIKFFWYDNSFSNAVFQPHHGHNTIKFHSKVSLAHGNVVFIFLNFSAFFAIYFILSIIILAVAHTTFAGFSTFSFENQSIVSKSHHDEIE